MHSASDESSDYDIYAIDSIFSFNVCLRLTDGDTSGSSLTYGCSTHSSELGHSPIIYF